MGEASAFDIEGIGKNFIPSVVDFDCIDDVLQVSETMRGGPWTNS
ncbi:MAG: hypothetical protein R3B51_02330 [Thermodesulfobacteriota bacterium]